MYTIGEFSLITHVSPRMLRYYDKMGLIVPAKIGPDNGYRYYEANQLSQILRIERYKGYGFRLSEIGELLELEGPALREALTRQREALLEEQAALKATLRQLDDELRQGRNTNMNEKQVVCIDNPAQSVYCLRRTINVNSEEIHRLFADLRQEMAGKGISPTGAAQLIWLGQEFSHENMEAEAQFVVADGTPGARIQPACRCVSAIHHGDRNRLHETYSRITAYLSEHPEVHAAGPVMERFINEAHDDSAETGVLFPVTAS